MWWGRSAPARPTGVRAERAAGRALPVARHTVTPASIAACTQPSVERKAKEKKGKERKRTEKTRVRI